MACWPFDLPSRLRSPVILPVYVHELFFCNNIRAGIHISRAERKFFRTEMSKTRFTKISLEVIGRSTDSAISTMFNTVRHNYCSHLAGWGRISLSLSLDRDRTPFVVSHGFRSLCGTLPLPLPWTFFQCFLY